MIFEIVGGGSIIWHKRLHGWLNMTMMAPSKKKNVTIAHNQTTLVCGKNQYDMYSSASLL